jgi:uncharacterized protein DUF222
VVDLTRRHHRLVAQLQSVGLIRELDSRGIPDSLAACNTKAYLSGAFRMSPHLASEQTRLAALGQRYPDTAAALAEGEISYEQAKAIAFTVDDVTRRASAEQRGIAESPPRRRRHAQRLRPAPPAQTPRRRDRPRRDPRPRGRRPRPPRRGFKEHDGTQSIVWRETDENIATVKAAITALAAPAPATAATPDPRTPAQRRADALLEIITRTLRHGDSAANSAASHWHTQQALTTDLERRF